MLGFVAGEGRGDTTGEFSFRLAVNKQIMCISVVDDDYITTA